MSKCLNKNQPTSVQEEEPKNTIPTKWQLLEIPDYNQAIVQDVNPNLEISDQDIVRIL